jgi:hypothetical protein
VLIAKGYTVSFTLAAGGTVKAPAGYGLLHDPTGRSWAKCSGLVCSFRKDGDEIEDGEAKSYFGKDPLGGELALPPKSLSEWKKLGPVTEIRYTRKCPGRKCDNAAAYYHPFEQGKLPMLYRRGKMLRLELGSGCEWNYRGIVRP